MSDFYIEGVPEGIPADSLDLSPDESRSFPRWYTDLLLRKGNQAVSLDDALRFVGNFGLKEADKQSILGLFKKGITTLDPCQFYIFLRLAGHILDGKTKVEPEMIYMPASVPRPRSILSRKRKNELTESDSQTATQGVGNPFRKTSGSSHKAPAKMDIDSFATFLLTGNRPASNDEDLSGGSALSGQSKIKKKKRVTFDAEPQVSEAAARSMEELMRQADIQQQLHAAQVARQPPPPPQYHVNGRDEEEEEDDVNFTNNAFANVKVDSVLVHGVSVAAPEPQQNNSFGSTQSLAQFASNFNQQPASPSPPVNGNSVNGTLEFAKMFAPPPGQQTTSSNISSSSLYPDNTNSFHRVGELSGSNVISPQSTGLHPQSASSLAQMDFSPRNTPSPDPSSFPSIDRFVAPSINGGANRSHLPPPPPRPRASSVEQPMNHSTGHNSAPPSIFFPGGQYPSANNSSSSSLSSFPSLPVHNTSNPSPLGLGGHHSITASSSAYSSSPSLPQQQASGGLPFIAPPPPVPRRSVSSSYRQQVPPQQNYQSLSLQQQYTSNSGYDQAPPTGDRARNNLPPPPPPRRRAPSLPGRGGAHEGSYNLQVPDQAVYALNASSAPDLVGDVRRMNINR